MQIQDKIIFDGLTKNATIMRDGIYYYLGKEVGDTVNPNKIVRVYRDKAEIEKAYKRFNDLQRIPLTVNHPQEFVNLNDEASYSQGIALDPLTKIVKNYNTLGCRIDLKDQALEYYNKGKKELSCGWTGSFKKVNNNDYDYTQHFEDFNHIAILPNGRGGSLCSITDNNLNILNMDIEEFKIAITDTVKSALEVEKKKVEDEGKEISYTVTLDTEELVKNLDSSIKAFSDAREVENSSIKDEARIEAEKQVIKDFDCVLKAIEKGAIEVKDCLGKSPFEVKKEVVKSIAKKDIEDSKLDAYFDVSLENFKHSSWEKKGQIADKGSEEGIASILDNINFLDN